MEGEFLIIAGIRSQAGLFTGWGVNHFRSLVKRKLEKIVHWKWDSGKQPKFWLNRGKLLRKLQSCYDQPLRVLELREEGTIRLVRTHKNRDFVALPPPCTHTYEFTYPLSFAYARFSVYPPPLREILPFYQFTMATIHLPFPLNKNLW